MSGNAPNYFVRQPFRQYASQATAGADKEDTSSIKESPWTVESRRTGALALKVGMVAIFDKWGKRWPCTALYLDNCKVTQVKTEQKEGFIALQVE